MVTLKTIHGMGGTINLINEARPDHILGQDVRLVRTHYPYEDNREGRTFDPIEVVLVVIGSVVHLRATEDQFVPKGETVLHFDSPNIDSIKELLGDMVITLNLEYLGEQFVTRSSKTTATVIDTSTTA